MAAQVERGVMQSVLNLDHAVLADNLWVSKFLPCVSIATITVDENDPTLVTIRLCLRNLTEFAMHVALVQVGRIEDGLKACAGVLNDCTGLTKNPFALGRT